MRRKIASSRRLKSKMRRNLLSLRPVKPRGPALRVSFSRKNTTLSLFLPLSWEKEDAETRREVKKERRKNKVWASESGWRRERGISLCVTLPSRGFLFAFGLKEEHLSRCRVFVRVCVTRNARISLQWKEQRVGGVAISGKASSATKLERRVYE